ncbi:UPF0149 family protein [Chlorobium sp. N1]|uniref:UPF0149 family protein n=1 Tax=Chlorobium sp. N1 TaxID=2491138 RepID=UPI00103FC4E9|nr:UPF0149 family protein [Chlorobium sp. N1]TCD48932.1 YecA family protein [Chlorobium sp. N1]
MLVYELDVSLLHAEPPVWRRVRMPADAQLPLVHTSLQLVMGWEGRHLHEFAGADGRRYGEPGEEGSGEDVFDERHHTLRSLFSEPGERCLYRYDFGDDWAHELVLRSVGELGPDEYPLWCLDGSGACPPEDCGGVAGYAALFGSPGEEGEADAFDCAPFNEEVGRLFPRDEDMRSPESVSEGMALLVGLRDLLETGGTEEGTMSVMMLDGFFAALAIHPETIMPDRWLPWVWDITGDGREPAFSSKGEVEQAMGLLFTYYNSVLGELGDDAEGYLPLFDELGVDSPEERPLAVRDWAEGFMCGAMIDEAVWDRTFEDEQGKMLLTPFAMMAGMFDEAPAAEQRQLKEMKEALLDELDLHVLDLREFWAPWRREYLSRHGGGTIRSEARAGRNDRCPCGSGKKYKQCCGR